MIQKVKDVIYQGMSGDIITANQNLRNLFFKENSFPFGTRCEPLPILEVSMNIATAIDEYSIDRRCYIHRLNEQ